MTSVSHVYTFIIHCMQCLALSVLSLCWKV